MDELDFCSGSLTIAAQRGDLDAAAEQLVAGADIDEQDKDGNLALHLACRHGHGGVLKLLIDAGADVDLLDRYGWSPLHRAVSELADSTGHGIVSMLIGAGADVNSRTNGARILTPLLLALRQRKAGMAAQLIRAGASLLADVDDGTFSLIYPAIDSGDQEIVAEMITAGADIDAADFKDFSVMHWAAEHGQQDIVAMLISAGADIEIHGDYGVTPLHIAVFYGREAVMSLLIEAQADVNCRCSPAMLGATPVIISSLVKRSSVLRMLIRAGARVNTYTTTRLSALHMAALTGDRESCEILHEAGATASQRDPTLRLFLAMAAKKGHSEVADLFSRWGITTRRVQAAAVTCVSLAREPTQAPSINAENESSMSMSLSESMQWAGFNSVNATVQCGAAALMQEFSRRVQGSPEMFLFGSFADGWGSCLTAIDGRVDDDSDIDITYLKYTREFCLQGICQRPNCQYENSVPYQDGHILVSRQVDATSPNSAVGSVLSNTSIDFIRAHKCCCYPPIELLTPGYQTKISPDIIKALNQEVHSPNSQCHVVSAESPRLPRGHSMRVSTTLLETITMHSLTTVQGQVFILLKYLIKKVMTSRVIGLKTYVAKNLLFYMLDRTPVSDWQAENVICLVGRALTMLLEMMAESESEDVCMRHFFLRDASVYLKRDHSPKEEIRECVKEVICKLPELLSEFQQKLTPTEVNTVHFHPFVQIFLWTEFPPINVHKADRWSNNTVRYDQTYDFIKLIFMKLSDPVSPEGRSEHLADLLRWIRMIPDHARTARECLEAMARIKAGERLRDASRCISDASIHTVSRGIPCPSGDEVPSSLEAAMNWVRNHLESQDSAWKFVFMLGFQHEADFAFLPVGVRLALAPMFRFGYWHINFEALSRALRATALPWGNPLPVIRDLRMEFGDYVFDAVIDFIGNPIIRIVVRFLMRFL